MRPLKVKYELLFASSEVKGVINKLKVKLDDKRILLPDNQDVWFNQEVNGVTTKKVIFDVSHLANESALIIRCENSDGNVDIMTIRGKEGGGVEVKIETTSNY